MKKLIFYSLLLMLTFSCEKEEDEVKSEIYSSAITIIDIEEPESIVCDNEGNLFISNWGKFNVKKYTESGDFIEVFIPDYTCGLLWLGNNQIAAVKSDDNKIMIYNTTDGSMIKEFGSQGTGDGQFEYPRRITNDDNGNFYITDYHNYRVQKFDKNGNFITKWTSYSPVWDKQNAPFGILYLNEKVIVTSNKNTQFFTKDGAYIETWEVPSYAITKDSKGCIYIPSGNKISKYSADGKLIALFGGPELSASFGIDVNDNGDVFVADYLNNKVYKYILVK